MVSAGKLPRNRINMDQTQGEANLRNQKLNTFALMSEFL
jgi:hypothetical protein